MRIAVDLGGTRLKAALLAGTGVGEVIAVEHGGAWLAALRSVVQRFSAVEVALCVPGIVADGRVVSLPGKLEGIENAALGELLGVRVPVLVNDAIAYGLGEACAGAGRGASRIVVVTLGTGVGVAVVEDGAVLGRGPLGGGVLGGQLPLVATGGADTAGRSGTFEALCRADALVAAVPEAVDVASAYALVSASGPDAAPGFSAYRAALVRGLTALALAHAPERIVVGGGAARPPLMDGLEPAVQAGLWPGQSVEVRLAERGDAAALHGLAALLRAQVSA